MIQSKQIDLKNRCKHTEKQKEISSVSVPVYLLDETSLDEVAGISELLDKVGISIQIDRYEDSETLSSYDMLRFKVSTEQYKKAMTRHAGRKQNFIEKCEKYKACTVGELKEYRNNTTKVKIAEELGCSRMTLYRIIKNIAKYHPEDHMSIWHYTSGT